MPRHTPTLLLALCLLVPLLLAACQPAAPPTFDRGALLRTLVEGTILPNHRAFAAEAARLAEATQALQAAPSEATLAAAQAQWRRTAEAWARVEPFELGAARDAFLFTRLHKWPPNERLIAEHLAGEAPIDEPFIEGIGSTAKGLPAIEYLLFDPQGLAAFEGAGGARRLAYIAAASANLQRTAEALLAVWSPEGANYAQDFIAADSDGGALQSSISMIVNEMVGLLEQDATMKLATPMGRSTFGEPWPEAAEAPLSRHSLPLLIANIETMERTFHGGDDPEALGLDDLLAFRGIPSEGEPLEARIDAQFERTLAALRAIDQPLAVAVVESPEAVYAAQGEVEALLVLFKVDLAAQLGITITFNDNDGD